MDEEQTCEALDGPLTTILKDNPELLAVLMQALQRDVKVVGGEPEDPLVSGALARLPYQMQAGLSVTTTSCLNYSGREAA